MNALLAMGRGDVDHSALVLLVEQPGSVEILTQPDLKSGKKPEGGWILSLSVCYP